MQRRRQCQLRLRPLDKRPLAIGMLVRFRSGCRHADPDHHREDQSGSRPARGARRQFRPDPAGRRAPAAIGRTARSRGCLEILGLRAAQAGRALSDATGERRQQAGQAEGHRRGPEDLRPGHPGDRLRPRGAVDRPGDPGTPSLSRHGASRTVHGPGPKVLAAGVRQAEAQSRVAATLRCRRRAAAGRPDLQPVTDPHGNPHTARSRHQGRHRHRPGKDADAGDRLHARNRDPGFSHRGLLRGCSHRQGRRRGIHHAACTAGQGPYPRARQGRCHRQGCRKVYRPACGFSRASASGTAAPVRPAITAKDLRPALGLGCRQNPRGRPGAVRRQRQEAHHLPARRSPPPG